MSENRFSRLKRSLALANVTRFTRILIFVKSLSNAKRQHETGHPDNLKPESYQICKGAPRVEKLRKVLPKFGRFSVKVRKNAVKIVVE